MTAIVILAAGSSSRMGSPKQNLVYRNQTLLQRMINNARSVSEQVLVILGANSEKIRPIIEIDDRFCLENPEWSEGMASSIRLAVNWLHENERKVSAILFMLCDQPFADNELLTALIETASQQEKGIIACSYGETIGVPALFKAKYFPDLLQLTGFEGAKKLMARYPDDVTTVSFPRGLVDIDTDEDFRNLKTIT